MKVPFVKPFLSGNEFKYMKDAILNGSTIAGDGTYTQKVHKFFEDRYNVPRALLTTSASTALEMSIRLLELERGDEVIVPSFTFSSTVNAILLGNGIKAVFADVDKDTLNIDPADVELKITSKTRAIMVVHYAGISCDMRKIMQIAKKHNLKVIEDAAQCIESKYKDKYLGTIGDMGVLSFHSTKNVTCGEGGILFINRRNKKLIEKAEIIREKGTDRSRFLRGEVDKYTWVSLGSSVLPSDILAAFLWAQLENLDKNTKRRIEIFNNYYDGLKKYKSKGTVKLPGMPKYATHNGHIFYILFKNTETRDQAMQYLKEKGIGATFHYIPLHSSPFGHSLGFKVEDCPVTEEISHNLLRLPMHSNMINKQVKYVLKHLSDFLEMISVPKIIHEQEVDALFTNVTQ